MSSSMFIGLFRNQLLAVHGRSICRVGLWSGLLVVVAAVAIFTPEYAFLWASHRCEVPGYVRVPMDLPGNSLCLPIHVVKGSSYHVYIPVLLAPLIVACSGMWTGVLMMVAAVAAFFPELAFLWASRGCEVHGYVKIPLDLPGKSMCLPSHMAKGSSLDAFIPLIFAPIVVVCSGFVLKSFGMSYNQQSDRII